MEKIKIIRFVIIIFTIEKMLQHFISSLLFFIEIPGIGVPDIGPNFFIDNQTMGILNLLYFLVLFIGLLCYIKEIKWGLYIIIIFAMLDILLEFIFHHFLFITVSVISSTILTVLSIFYIKFKRQEQY